MSSKERGIAKRVCRTALAGLLAAVSPAVAGVTITSEAGYSITWNGNDGDYYTDAGPAPAPANLASDTGASAFASGVLGVGPHTTPEVVRNGTYGNVSSWIGSAATPNFIGINLNGTFDLNAIAWGRDNGTSTANGDSAGGFSGQFVDRSLGTYTVQITNVLTPDAATTSWTTVGTLTYDAVGNDTTPGGLFTPFLRHQYSLDASGGGSLLATGIRLIATSPGNDIAIDELEVYGASPVATSGLRSWLRGDGDVTVSGSSITQIGDHSLNGNHATLGIAPSVGSINGLGAATFDNTPAVNEHMNVAVLDDISNSDYEIFVVARSSSSDIQFIHGGASAAGDYELQINGASGARFIPSSTATASPDTFADLGVNGMFADGRAHLFNTRVEGGTGYLRVVGMENGDTVADATSSYLDGAFNRLTFGVRGNASLPFAGDMGEVLIYNRALSETERRDVERYLARKWNAPLNVASQTQGGVAFANQDYNGNESGNPAAPHEIDHLNNALYGNSESWLGNASGPGGYAGVKFDGAFDISSLAFGRSATNSHQDRWSGVYTFEFTRDDFDPTNLVSVEAATWEVFAVFDYINDAPDATPWLRHQYDLLSTILNVTGVRVHVSDGAIAIDELEIYGLASIPAPAALPAGLAMLGLVASRRRRRN